MAKTIVNLAMPAVIEETEDILGTYPHHPYQQAFSIPDMRQRLISYVLTRMPGVYTVVEDAEECLINHKSLCGALEHREEIQNLIHQGIQRILKENQGWIDRHIPEELDSELTPSNWFG